MKQKRNQRTRNKQEKKSYKIIRCSMQNQPMFEHEICPQFTIKTSANDQNNCKNCKHAF
ncbi:MAG: hypothetical protein ACXACC_10475 [Promethearchaeota archaeon]